MKSENLYDDKNSKVSMIYRTLKIFLFSNFILNKWTDVTLLSIVTKIKINVDTITVPLPINPLCLVRPTLSSRRVRVESRNYDLYKSLHKGSGVPKKKKEEETRGEDSKENFVHVRKKW